MPRPSPMPRPYGPNAAWNRLVSGLPVRSDSATWVSRHWNSSFPTGQAGQFRLIAYDFSFSVFYASDATGTFSVSASNGNMNGQTMPWNPAWSTAIVNSGGSDRQAIVINESNGYEYNLWQVTAWNGTNITCTTANLIQVGTAPGSGNPANYLTKENGYSPSRGVGIQLLAMLVRPEEFAAFLSTGQGIQHALCTPVPNPSGEILCPPGTKIEHPGTDSGNEVPEGMRFAHTKTDAQIEAWISSGSYPISSKSTAYKNLARMIAKATREYGWFITDTNGGGANWQLEQRSSASALWANLGIDINTQFGTISNVTLGMLSQSDIYTIVDSTQYPPPGGGGSPTDQKNQRGLLAGVNRGVLRGVV